MVGQQIQYFRKLRHLRQHELAAKIGVERSNISYYECGKYDIPVSRLQAIAAALEVCVCELLGEHQGCSPAAQRRPRLRQPKTL